MSVENNGENPSVEMDLNSTNSTETCDSKFKECQQSLNEKVVEKAQDKSDSCANSPIHIKEVQSTKDTECSDKKAASDLSEVIVNDVNKLNISDNKKEGSKSPKSAVIINRESESLKCLHAYDENDSDDSESSSAVEISDTSDEDDDEQEEKENNSKKTTTNSELGSSEGTSDTESDSSTEDSSEDSSDDNCSEDSLKVISVMDVAKKTPKEDVREEDLLPPVPDCLALDINIDDKDFLHMGQIFAIVEKLVTVEALPGTPAFNLETMLFVEEEAGKKPLGTIFDVLGPVAAPLYCVRFNSIQDIADRKLKSGLNIYVAPKQEELTKYVFVKELMKMKGTDASWLNDEERPEEMADYSDDEKEVQARRGSKRSTLKRRHNDSLERHQQYERTMNQCNLLNTRVSRLMDTHQNLSRQIRAPARQPMETSTLTNPWTGLNPTSWTGLNRILPPDFDPSVPPPGYQANLFRQMREGGGIWREANHKVLLEHSNNCKYNPPPGPSSNGC